MAQTDRVDVLFPPGRIVAGSVKEARTTDNDGRPLVVKNGPNAGQPRVEYSFGVAIPKQGEQHWNQTPWGGTVWNTAQQWFPQGQAQGPNFSWKIADGDDQNPNTMGVRNCDREGYPGNWVVYFSSGIAPRTYNRDGTSPLDAQAFEKGYFVEVFGNIASNGQTQQPGIYINHSMVALNGYGEVIRSGPDPSQAGFGQAGTAPGAQQTPPAGVAPTSAPPQGSATPPQQPPAQQGPANTAPPPQQGPAASAPPPGQPQQPAQGAVQPDHGFVQNAASAPPPGQPQQPPQEPAPPVEKRYQYQGQVYTEAQLLGWNWTPQQIEQNCTPA